MTDPEVYAKVQKERKLRRLHKRIAETLTKFNLSQNDIYITIQPFSQNIPAEILSKAVGIGNGIFIINFKHLEEYAKSNAGNQFQSGN